MNGFFFFGFFFCMEHHKLPYSTVHPEAQKHKIRTWLPGLRQTLVQGVKSLQGTTMVPTVPVYKAIICSYEVISFFSCFFYLRVAQDWLPRLPNRYGYLPSQFIPKKPQASSARQDQGSIQHR